MSSSGPKAGALLVAVLQLSTQLALGGRSHLQGPEGGGDDAEGLLPDREGTCGRPEVWRRLTGDPSVEGVQNINWQKVDAVIEERLAAWSGKIAKLEVETQGLEARVAEKKANVTTLITESLRPFSDEGRGGLENAQLTMCREEPPRSRPGKKRPPVERRPGAPRGAFLRSLEAFKVAADEYFKEKVRCSGEDFRAECGRLLPAGSGEQLSWCSQLCQRFRDTYQELCDEIGGETVGKGSDKLDEELEQKLEELAAARSAQSACEGVRDFISGFRKQIKTQRKELEARFGDYQVAEENLEDASWSLDAAEEALIRCGCLAVVPPPS